MQYMHKAQPTVQLMWENITAERGSAEWGYCGEKVVLHKC